MPDESRLYIRHGRHPLWYGALQARPKDVKGGQSHVQILHLKTCRYFVKNLS